ncbi:MAG: hypothetical protein DIJKHBIC_00770 [Thermoanaerobaculia bacterium]|nr:hypothetical protein [Thermoanaerobaculia bacterium]
MAPNEHDRRAPDGALSWLFPLTIGLGAFLLFQVQFILGKLVLPWFGGAPAAWTACMLFFQTGLLLGYGYAHGLVRLAGAGRQRALHLAIIGLVGGLSAYRLFIWSSPLTPPASFAPAPGAEPVSSILLLLTSVIGLPFLVLSATSPLLQAWSSRVHPERSPYPLYALSNAGSLLGLLSYPFAVEPFLTLPRQGQLWAGLFLFYLTGCAAAAWRAGRPSERGPLVQRTSLPEPPLRVRPQDILFWFLLAAVPSILLLAITSQLTQEVAVIPFLWVIPLTIYLVTFILCFEYEGFYRRGLFAVLFLVSAAGSTLTIRAGVGIGVVWQIVILSGALFVFGSVCHGELVRAKPHPSRLTLFYLVLAAGGAFGGVFNGVVAPRFFLGLWELPFGILLALLVVFAVVVRDRESWFWKTKFWPYSLAVLLGSPLIAIAVQDEVPAWIPKPVGLSLGVAGAALGIAFLAIVLGARRAGVAIESATWRLAASILFIAEVAFALHFNAVKEAREALYVSRNFFGLLRVIPNPGTSLSTSYLALRHGRITHGIQPMDPERVSQPTSYYGERSGVGLALRYHPRRDERPVKAGLVGLGVGTIAAFARPGDAYRFYEINPAVLELSTGKKPLFKYLANCKGTYMVILGDARLSLEREEAQDFDVLALDAFSSDSIPVHLLTSEAFDVYLKHVRTPDGVLAVHVSNRFLELEPVIAAQAKRLELKMARIDSSQEGDMVWSSDWILLTRGAFLEHSVMLAAAHGWEPAKESVLWTDTFSNLFRVIKKKKAS